MVSTDPNLGIELDDTALVIAYPELLGLRSSLAKSYFMNALTPEARG